MHLALDKVTNDLFDPVGGVIKRVSNGRFVVQQVSCKLKTLLGEWFLDRKVGYIELLVDIKKNPDLFDLESRLQEIVINTKNVLSVDSITLNITDRVLKVDFVATTTFGIIDTRVPWKGLEEISVNLPDPDTLGLVTYFGETVTDGGIAITYQIMGG